MTWHEEQHPRGPGGEFTHASVGAWAKQLSERFRQQYGEVADEGDLQYEHELDHRPPGHAAAVERLQHLWRVPSERPPAPGQRKGERTDAEQEELDALEQAFDTYRQHLGLRESRKFGPLYAENAEGGLHDRFGGSLASAEDVATGRVHERAPYALRAGYRRVGEHPTGQGRAGGENSYLGRSVHLQAGGLWIDPARPGTPHAPRYLNDAGDIVSSLRPEASRSEAHKDRRRGLRAGKSVGRPAGFDNAEVRTFRFSAGVYEPGIMRRPRDEVSAEFLAAMKRLRARARQEQVRDKVRRTPRGTRVEKWMQA